MKAWLWDGQAGLDHLRLEEVPDPVAKEGEVVMEIHYAALNPADRMMAERRYPTLSTPGATRVGAGRRGDRGSGR